MGKLDVEWGSRFYNGEFEFLIWRIRELRNSKDLEDFWDYLVDIFLFDKF